MRLNSYLFLCVITKLYILSIRQEIETEYEALYQCLCSQYSSAYLMGSDYFVGDNLYDWWVNTEKNKKSIVKWFYIKDILDNFKTI